jgi:hypothetical protein
VTAKLGRIGLKAAIATAFAIARAFAAKDAMLTTAAGDAPISTPDRVD